VHVSTKAGLSAMRKTSICPIRTSAPATPRFDCCRLPKHHRASVLLLHKASDGVSPAAQTPDEIAKQHRDGSLTKSGARDWHSFEYLLNPSERISL